MNRGFTIIELIVVVTTIAILASLVTFGSASMINRGRQSEAKSILMAVRSGLEKYYSENNEYPPAATLAGGGDGRNLSTAQYNTIATTLGMNVSSLRTSTYKFVPCSVSGSACTIGLTDDKYILYLTRTASDVASSAARTYTTPSSTCTYTFPAPTIPSEAGYSTYLLVYRDPTNTDWWTQWNVYGSNNGTFTWGAWCPVNHV